MPCGPSHRTVGPPRIGLGQCVQPPCSASRSRPCVPGPSWPSWSLVLAPPSHSFRLQLVPTDRDATPHDARPATCTWRPE
eukprot:1515706-Prymnesium_polylepis.1